MKVLRLPDWWRNVSLRARLVVTVATVISLIQLADVIGVLSREVADLDYRVASTATILAQSVAATCATLITGSGAERFDGAIGLLRDKLDLVEMAIIDTEGKIVGHSDPGRVGTLAPRSSLAPFQPPRRSPGLHGLFTRYTEYSVSAPIVHGTEVRGFVWFVFRSREVSDRATDLILSATGMGALWVVVGGLIATLYVRRITEPLASLTHAVTAVSENRVEQAQLEEPTSGDEVGRLQRSFKRLLEALREQRAENARLLAEQEQLNLRLRDAVEDMSVDLSHQYAYLEAVLACMEEGVITCDLTGRIVQVNAGAKKQLHGLAVPAPGVDIGALLPQAPALQPAVEEAIRTGNRTSVEVAIRSTDRADLTPTVLGPMDDRRTLVFRAYPLLGGNGAVLGTLVMVVDWTHERRVQRQLRRHDRLISLGTLAAGLAHELGNYMHTINGFSTLVLRDAPPESELRRNAESIRRDSTQAVALLERFLQFARPGVVQHNPEPVARLLNESLDLCAYRLRNAGVALDLDVGRAGLIVSCDRRQILQVFVNLALNAIDALKGRPSPRLVVRAQPSGPDIEISVTDNGCGIAPEHLEHIFDPFFTTKQAEGTGLGLSIANQIVEMHGGRLAAESQPGRGTTFRVILPADAAKKEAPV